MNTSLESKENIDSQAIDSDQEIQIQGDDSGDSRLSAEEFVIYTSPRYYRLLFPQYKPVTKNGDLVSALGEMKKWGLLTPDSDWDRIKTTKKGSQYRKLIKRLLDINALHVPQGTGIFDYRSEPGRKVIVELICFLSAKLDFNEYIRYLSLPVFAAEKTKEWTELFTSTSETQLDLSESGREQLLNFLKKQSRKMSKESNGIQKVLTNQTTPININLTFVKKFFQNEGLNRPEPLFNHFNAGDPQLFSVHDRNFSVNLAELMKIKKILEEHVDLFNKEDNKWLDDYFNLLKLPTKFFGFQVSEFSFGTKEADAFLNLAIEGPRIFANQFSSIPGLGELELIAFPLNASETIVIYCTKQGIMYYFTIKTEEFGFTVSTSFQTLPDFPESFATSRKRFGKLISRTLTSREQNVSQKILELEQKEKEQKEMKKETREREPMHFGDTFKWGSTDDRRSLSDERKMMIEELKNIKNQIQENTSVCAQISASLFSICQLIVQKYANGFFITKCFCIYEKGFITLTSVDEADALLTTITMGKIEYGSETKKMLKRIEESMQEILDFPVDEQIKT